MGELGKLLTLADSLLENVGKRAKYFEALLQEEKGLNQDLLESMKKDIQDLDIMYRDIGEAMGEEGHECHGDGALERISSAMTRTGGLKRKIEERKIRG